jgi:hypothetical protein
MLPPCASWAGCSCSGCRVVVSSGGVAPRFSSVSMVIPYPRPGDSVGVRRVPEQAGFAGPDDGYACRGPEWTDCIDLSSVTFLDSSGLGMVVAAHRAAAAQGITVQLRNPGPVVRMVLEVTDLLDVLAPAEAGFAPADERCRRPESPFDADGRGNVSGPPRAFEEVTQMSNETPNTPDLSETELRDKKVGELREQAKKEGVGATSSMRKEELVDAISEAHRGGGSTGNQGGSGGGGDDGRPGDAGPDGGRLRTGAQTSKSIKYSQEVTSADDEPERPGRSLATTSHEVIRQWAEERNGVPATVDGTEHGDHLGVLRIDFGGDDANLRQVSWDEWFGTFDARRLNFIYQEARSDGRQSSFFRLESPDREDG